VLSCARIAKQAGAKVICFTSYARNPLVLLSDIAFVAVSNEAQNYRESMTARLTQLVIGDCLMDYVVRELGDEAVELLDSTVEIFESNRENLLTEPASGN
jgi:DNA-binding MurR/RpiR family transcriptional regulator